MNPQRVPVPTMALRVQAHVLGANYLFDPFVKSGYDVVILFRSLHSA